MFIIIDADVKAGNHVGKYVIRKHLQQFKGG